MPVRKANAVWNGNLKEGNGRIALDQGRFEQPYSFSSRFEEGSGTNPEELIGAALAGCFSQALAAALGKAGFNPRSIRTGSAVHIDKVGESFKITKIELNTEAQVPEIQKSQFMEAAETTKNACPVSKALAGTEITLNARLLEG